MIMAQSSNDVIVSLPKGAKERRSERLAIIVGINEYYHNESFRNLSYAVEDSKVMGDILERKGNFTVERYADDWYSSKPTKRNIMEAVYRAYEEVTDGYVKTLVFYFSGHGFELNKRQYLAVGSTDASRPGTAISLEEVLSILSEAQKRAKVIVLVDACRNDLSKGGGYDSWSDINSYGLAVLSSTLPGKRSYEHPRLKHGVFTYFLAEGLSGNADYNNDGYVSYNEVNEYVSYEMYKWSEDHSDIPQYPHSYKSIKTGEFYITKVKKRDSPPPPKPPSNNTEEGIFDHFELGLDLKFGSTGLGIGDYYYMELFLPMAAGVKIYFDMFLEDWFGVGIETELCYSFIDTYSHYLLVSDDSYTVMNGSHFFGTLSARAVFEFDLVSDGSTKVPLIVKLGLMYPDSFFNFEVTGGAKYKISSDDLYFSLLLSLGIPQLCSFELALSFKF